MTTAHRPTWAPAIGGEEQGGMRIFAASRAYSAKDQAAHTKMKMRADGQATRADLEGRDFKAELLSKEKEHYLKSGRLEFAEEREKDLLLLQGGAGAAQRSKVLVPRAADADIDDGGDDSSSEDESDDDDDDSDDEAELLAELARIKAERAEEAAKKAAEEEKVKTKEQEEELIRSNPLMADTFGVKDGFQVKRRWDDDVVFRNQSRGEPKAQKRFINDTIRNDFHKKFLHRYIK